MHNAGLSVFPLTHPVAHRGESEAGKKPMLKWSQFQTRRPTEREVRGWFGGVDGPSALRNIGIALGPISGCIVIDVDSPGAIGALRDDGYPVPPKWVATAKGEHWYYGWDDQHPIGNRAKISVGGTRIPVDVRGQGGYVVGPGSLHDTGHVYALNSEGGYEWAALPVLPPDLAMKIEVPRTMSSREWTPRIADLNAALAMIELSASGTTRLVLRGAVKQGERNEMIYRAARDLNGLGVEAKLAESLIMEKLVCDPNEQDGFRKTIASAYSSPAAPTCAFLFSKMEQVQALQKDAAEAAKTVAAEKLHVNKVEAPVAPPSPQPLEELREKAGMDEVFSNVKSVLVTLDGGETETVHLWRDPEEIVRQARSIGKGYPKIVNGALFCIERWKSDTFLTSENFMFLGSLNGAVSHGMLFGWLHSKCPNGMFWKEGVVRASVKDATQRSPLAKGELAPAISAICPEVYTDVSAVPTHPVIPNCFYLYPKLPDPTPGSETFFKFIDLFNPDSPEDRTLIMAMILTMFWGGHPGQRPFFVVTSDHGRGAGKTRTIMAAALVAGGHVGIDLRQTDQSRFFEPMVASGGMLKRVAIADNVKGKVDHPMLEAFITGAKIQGRVNYIGPVERSNYFTCVMTGNNARLSADMTSRSVTIKIGRPRHKQDFDGVVRRFLAKNHLALISDIIAMLRGPALQDIPEDKYDRWQQWQTEVLAKCPGFIPSLDVIAERRQHINADAEEAMNIEPEIIRLTINNGTAERSVREGTFKFSTQELYTFMERERTLPNDNITLSNFGIWLANKAGDLPGLRKVTRNGSRAHWSYDCGRERAQEIFEEYKSAQSESLYNRNDKED